MRWYVWILLLSGLKTGCEQKQKKSETKGILDVFTDIKFDSEILMNNCPKECAGKPNRDQTDSPDWKGEPNTAHGL